MARLRSSRVIFNSMADTVEWILSDQILLHYHDDYLNVAYQSCSSAQRQLNIILEVFRYLGIPIAEE